MNFFKRAITSITRRLGKTLILLILVFILGNVIAGAISIRQAVTNTEVNMRQKIGAIATLEMDYDKLSGKLDIDYNNLEYINADQINKIGELPYIKHYDYTSSTSLESETVKRYRNPESQNSRDGMVVYDVSASTTMDEYSYFSITGGQNTEPMDMKENKIKLSQGRLFTEEEMKNGTSNKILISKNVADLNNLTIGATFKLVMKFYKYEGLEGGLGAIADISPMKPVSVKEFEFEIVGIFETIKETKTNEEGQIDFNYLDEERENRIYTSNAVVKNINDIMYVENLKLYPDQDYPNREYFQPVFVLNDPLDLPKFREEARPLLPEYYKITDNGASFDKVAAPMKNMQWIASIVLYVAIGATLVILSLLITLFLRDRKHEIGIYLSLGEKKIRVIYQILTEVVLISIVAITLSLFTGNVIAGIMSEQMLNNQIIAEQEKENEDSGIILRKMYSSWSMLDSMGYGSDVDSEDLVESYSVSLGATTVLMFYLVGIGTVLVSTLIPIIYIVRLNPKKIMM